MGTDRSFGFCYLDNGIGQTGDGLCLSCPPGKFNIHMNAPLLKKPARHVNKLCGYLLAVQLFNGIYARVTRDSHHPACWSLAYFGVNQIGDYVHLRIVFHGPVFASDAGIEHA